MDCFLGIDLGTSSLKIIAASANGEMIGSVNKSFSIISEKEGFSEENPKDWVKALDAALLELLAKYPQLKINTRALSFSGQMHSLVLIDKTGEPIRNAILWNDTRTSEEVKFLNNNFKNHLLNKEKNIALEGFTLPKILWIQKHEPNNWEKTFKFMMPKDFLVYYLTEKVNTDYSDASGTLMLQIEERSWDKELLADLKIELKKCPQIVSSDAIVGKVKSILKEKYGFAQDVDVVMGGADNACGALGNISEEKQGLLSVGTSGVVLYYSNDPAGQIGKYHYFNSAIDGKDYKMGVTLSAGYSLDWYKKTFLPNQSFDEVSKLAENSKIGSNGITFLPYLFGERSPHYNPKLFAEIIGIRAHHNLSDITRAVMEGISFSLLDVYENMEEQQKKTIKVFRITGGVIKNPFWIQMFADIFKTEIETIAMEEGPAFGALLLAISAETNETFDKIWARFTKIKQKYFPIEENVGKYQTSYQRYLLYSRELNEKNK
ncbi:xylulokinase [Enterococcus hirae]|nr:xylulokinase [Enterococcus hirae]